LHVFLFTDTLIWIPAHSNDLSTMKIRLLIALTALLVCFTAQAQTPSPTAPASTPPATDSSQASSAAYQSIDPAKAAEIRKMLELTGTVKLMKQVMNQMIDSFKTRNSHVSSEFWDRFESNLDTNDLVDKMIPLYDKYYTLDDLKAINAFYESPAGQRVLAVTPQIMHESMQIGQEWGRGVGAKIATELEKEKLKEAAAAPSSTSASTPASAPASTPTPTSTATPASTPPGQ